MTNGEKKIIKQIGFEKDVTQEVIDNLKQKTTKIAKDVLNKIERVIAEKKIQHICL